MNDRPTQSVPRLVLGTVQLGMPYGIANVSGMPGEAAAFELIAAAIEAGITDIDTARAYGESEARIGNALARLHAPKMHVVTKLAPLSHNLSRADAIAAAKDSLVLSRQALRRDRLDTLLLHRAADRLAWDGAIWDLLRAEQASGHIGRLGVSVQSPAEGTAALDDAGVVHIQMPYNLLDARWDEAGVVARLRTRPEVTVHTRSTLLQGVLTLPPDLPWPNIDPATAADVRNRIDALARDLRNGDVVDLCLAFARGNAWIDGIVLGMETAAQLRTNCALFSRPPLDAGQVAIVRAALPWLPAAFLDPAQWRTEAPGRADISRNA